MLQLSDIGKLFHLHYISAEIKKKLRENKVLGELLY